MVKRFFLKDQKYKSAKKEQNNHESSRKSSLTTWGQ